MARRFFFPPAVAVKTIALVFVTRAAPSLAASPPVDLVTESLVYADNTEFFNPYRTGETIFGLWVREYFRARLGGNVELHVGVFADERFGDERSFSLVRPELSLRIASGHSRFVLGTLETVRRADGMGPDLTTVHGLLPPIQIETLAFTRPYENGVQWIFDSARVKNDLWLSWQKLNTPEHREVLDAGTAGKARIGGPFWAGLQFHVVHHGGQLYDVGPVTDSFAYGPGVGAEGPFLFFDRAAAEVYLLFSKDKRNREDPTLTTSGHGTFLRLAGEKEGWRAHVVFWRASDFVKEEGDANYLSRSEDGSTFRSTRTYAELGLSKILRPVEGVEIEPSARLHRIDTAIEYSYRVIAKVTFDLPVVH